MGGLRGLLDELARVGEATFRVAQRTLLRLAFLGEVPTAFGRWSVGRARFGRGDLLSVFATAGARLLPLVTTLGFLLGLIATAQIGPALARAGAVSKLPSVLASLTLREVGALLAALVVAGQIAPAFTVEIATIPRTADASTEPTATTRVLPRLLVTCASMPLICLYTEAAMLAGAVVGGLGIEGITVDEFVERTGVAIAPVPLFIGLGKAVVFGAAIALCGCAAGLRLAAQPAVSSQQPSASLDPNEISETTRRASAAAIFWILVLDGLVTAVVKSLGV